MAANVSIASPVSAPDHSQVLIARQPIFDVDLKLHGYELLYRSLDRTADIDVDAASSQMITVGFMDIGLTNLVENKLAYLKVSADFLASRDAMALPAARVALEFPGDTSYDAEFLALLDEYRAEGYRLVAGCGTVTRETLPLLKRSQAIKFDVQALGLDEAARQVGRIAPLQREIIANRVDTEGEFATLEALGVQFFQGFFFAKPKVVSGTRIASSKLTVLRLLASLYDAEAQVDEISALVSQDVGLSYKLMRFINSAALAMPRKIDSIQRAVVFMGLATVKRWASLIVVASIDDKPSELTRTLLVRARLCELLCKEIDIDDPGAAFTVGLFSGLDALVDQ
ncbi:MAG: EAL and modified HD-GYP domain-containing signal transduction protein, partial [Hyphomicrobiaceae bacterium]